MYSTVSSSTGSRLGVWRKGDVVEVTTYRSALVSPGVGGMSKRRRLDGDSLLLGVGSIVSRK